MQNLLLQAMDVRDHPAFHADLERTDAVAKSSLSVAGTSMGDVHFPIGAVIAARVASNGVMIEIRGIGREGMIGDDVRISPERLRYDLVCQISGPMLSMPGETFARHARHNPALAATLARYSASLLAFSQRSVACNALHTIAQRSARWVLITGDRAGAPEFPLTHDMLAALLGARRPGVSVAVKHLRDIGAVDYHAGRMRISDRRRLKRHACECYQIAVIDRSRIFRSSFFDSAPQRTANAGDAELRRLET